MSLRHVPPAAAPLAPSDLWHGFVGLLRPARAVAVLEQSLRDELGVEHVFLVSSGRAGLTLILRALRRLADRRRVVVPGYTCFSVAAAVVKADLDVVPCDLELETLDFDYAQLERLLAGGEAPLCVVPTHLFGLPADMARVRALCRDRGVFVVEDAAQALGLTTAAGKLGTLGDVGFYSFDRGKTVTSGHGGAIVTRSPEIARELAREYAALTSPGLVARLRTLVETAVLSVLIHPSLFWIPASLPFLRLGETVYSTDYPLERLSGVEAGLLAHWRERARELNDARARRVEALRQARPDLVSARAGACIRLPILCASRQERDRVYGTGRREGLGFSLMYPAAVTRIPELQASLSGDPCPVSEQIAERLLTVPVHPLVSAEDAAAIEKVLDGVRRPVH